MLRRYEFSGCLRCFGGSGSDVRSLRVCFASTHTSAVTADTSDQWTLDWAIGYVRRQLPGYRRIHFDVARLRAGLQEPSGREDFALPPCLCERERGPASLAGAGRLLITTSTGPSPGSATSSELPDGSATSSGACSDHVPGSCQRCQRREVSMRSVVGLQIRFLLCASPSDPARSLKRSNETRSIVLSGRIAWSLLVALPSRRGSSVLKL